VNSGWRWCRSRFRRWPARASGFSWSRVPGAAAWFPDGAYERAGAKTASRDEVVGGADVLVSVGAPAQEPVARLLGGRAVIGMLRPLTEPELARQLARAGVTAISVDGLPRTVSRAQSMDALTSQANVAGYKAVLVAADHFGRFFPMLINRGRGEPAGERPRARRGGGGFAGLGHRAPAGRRGDRLRHPAGDP
jgi:NAD(P) transhydrogenase subunit alpha